MPAHLSTVPPVHAHGHPADRLTALAHLLADDALAPSLCGIVADRDELELHVRPLSGPDPVLELFGFVAPASWDALGVAVSGRAHRLGDESPPPPAKPHVVVGLLLDRSGRVASVLRRHGQPPVVVEDHECGEPSGLLVDSCRRALQLPTPPPDRTPSAMVDAVWLDRVVAAAAADPARPPTRDELAQLHPALHRERAAARRTQPPRSVLPRAVERFRRTTWAAWRATAVADPELEAGFGLPEGAARWMDDGMLSRWLLAGLPDPAELRASAGELLPTRTAEWVIGLASGAEPGP